MSTIAEAVQAEIDRRVAEVRLRVAAELGIGGHVSVDVLVEEIGRLRSVAIASDWRNGPFLNMESDSIVEEIDRRVADAAARADSDIRFRIATALGLVISTDTDTIVEEIGRLRSEMAASQWPDAISSMALLLDKIKQECQGSRWKAHLSAIAGLGASGSWSAISEEFARCRRVADPDGPSMKWAADAKELLERFADMNDSPCTLTEGGYISIAVRLAARARALLATVEKPELHGEVCDGRR